MIAARLRFVALVAVAVAATAAAGLCARAGLLASGTLPYAAVAVACVTGAAHVRRTAHRLQERHRQALLLAELEAIEPRPDWCCERGWLTHGDLHHPDHCTATT